MLQTVKFVILGFLGLLVSTSALAQRLLKTIGMLHKKVKHPGFFAGWSRQAADRPLATGIYYAVLTSSSAKRIIKMVLMQKAAGGFILGLANSRDAAVPSNYSGLVSSGCSA